MVRCLYVVTRTALWNLIVPRDAVRLPDPWVPHPWR